MIELHLPAKHQQKEFIPPYFSFLSEYTAYNISTNPNREIFNKNPLKVINSKTGYILPLRLRDVEYYYDRITEYDKIYKN